MNKNIQTTAKSDYRSEYERGIYDFPEYSKGGNGKNPVYASQYKFLAKRSQLRVWVEKDKYEKFKRAVEKNGTSIYKLINEFVDNYIGEENVRGL